VVWHASWRIQVQRHSKDPRRVAESDCAVILSVKRTVWCELARAIWMIFVNQCQVRLELFVDGELLGIYAGISAEAIGKIHAVVFDE